MTTPPSSRASSSASADLPLAVGPQISTAFVSLASSISFAILSCRKRLSRYPASQKHKIADSRKRLPR